MNAPGARIEGLVDLLTQLATGDLAARGVRSAADDEIDAVIEGVNMLAEELQASRDELEARVRVRTMELQEVNSDILQLAELGNLLHACESADEAHAVTSRALMSMFAGLAGALYLFRPSGNVLELKASWGGMRAPDRVSPTDCWAVRRGTRHYVDADAPFLSCPHILARSGNSFCVPMFAHGEIIGSLHLMGTLLTGRQGDGLSAAKERVVLACAEQVSLALANLELRQKLQAQALRDPLTGLYNRRFLREWVDRDNSQRTGDPPSSTSLGVIMVDLDHFKQINDVHGHEAGDEMLQAAAAALRRGLRPQDLPCRYGGEEFLLLLPDIDLPTLQVRAEELRDRVSSQQVTHHGTTLPTATASVGVARYPDHGATTAQVIVAADAALYAAKHAGRNQTCTAHPPHERQATAAVSGSAAGVPLSRVAFSAGNCG